jgi:putative endonuclease
MVENGLNGKTPEEKGHSRNTRAKGASGEDIAVEYLLSKGYEIISRNYRARRGEIDCVARDSDGTLVFVEVKSAQSGKAGHPMSWVTRAKQRTIIGIARLYLAEHQITSMPCRFDVIAIVNGKVDHLRNAFLT